MIRILHLFEQQADFETRRGAEGLCRTLGEGFAPDLRTIGHTGDWRDLPTAAAQLRRIKDQFDIVHAWGPRALTVAALGSTVPIVFSPLAQTHRRTVQWLRAVASYRHVEVVCPTSTFHRRLVERGIGVERCHLVRPGVELARIQRKKSSTLRSELGLTESDYVLLAVGESTRAACHDLAFYASTVLHVLDPKYKLLVWGRGEMTPRLRSFATKLRGFGSLRFAEQYLGRTVDFEELPAVADAVVINASGPVATLPIAVCMAAARPIVSTTSYTVGELLEDRHTALMTGSKKQREFARRILDLEQDPSLQWSIADMARTEAFEFFSFTRFVNQFRTAYRQLAAGEPVKVPEDAPGAGLRFHGRA